MLSVHQLQYMYQQQLEHQKQETLAATAQVKLLSAKLEAETSARVEAQVSDMINLTCCLINTFTPKFIIQILLTVQEQMYE